MDSQRNSIQTVNSIRKDPVNFPILSKTRKSYSEMTRANTLDVNLGTLKELQELESLLNKILTANQIH